jgi:hypothetical protein
MILPLRTKSDVIYQNFGKSESFTKILVNQSDLPKIKTALFKVYLVLLGTFYSKIIHLFTAKR